MLISRFPLRYPSFCIASAFPLCTVADLPYEYLTSIELSKGRLIVTSFELHFGVGFVRKLAGSRKGPRRKPDAKNLDFVATNLPSSQRSSQYTQFNDGADPPSNIHPPQLAQRKTARRAPDADVAVSTPHGVFNPLRARRRPGRVCVSKNVTFLLCHPNIICFLSVFISMYVTSRESC